jgi:hypothetical protein
MDQIKRPKPKRKLSDINFESEGAHIALVSEDQGHGANGHHYSLLLKGSSTYSPEIIEKASKVQVTLPIEEFLRKFFGLYYEDAEILARAMGYTTESMDYEANSASSSDEPASYTDYIDSKVQGISIMKSMRQEDGSIATVSVLESLSGEDYITLLKSQEQIERAFTESEKILKARKESESEDKSLGSDSSTNNASVEKNNGPSGSNNETKKGTRMTKEVAGVADNMIEKSLLVEVQKALDEKIAKLSEMEAIVKQFEQDKKVAIVKARKTKLEGVVKNQEQAETLFKALGLVEDEATYDEVLKTLGSIQELADKSDLFKSIGADGAVDQKDEAGKDITKSLSARIQNKYKAK